MLWSSRRGMQGDKKADACNESGSAQEAVSMPELKTCGRRQEEVTVKYTSWCFKVSWWQPLTLVRKKWMEGFANSCCCHWQFILWHGNNLSGWNIVPLWFGSVRGIPARCQSIWTLCVPNQTRFWKWELVCSASRDVLNEKWKKQNVPFFVALSVAKVCKGVDWVSLILLLGVSLSCF